MKTSVEIAALVRGEIAGQWDHTNLHGVELKRCLIPPIKQKFVNASDELEVDAWLVLLANPESRLGWGVAYDDVRRGFGLVQLADGYMPMWLGLYKTFFETLDAM